MTNSRGRGLASKASGGVEAAESLGSKTLGLLDSILYSALVVGSAKPPIFLEALHDDTLLAGLGPSHPT